MSEDPLQAQGLIRTLLLALLAWTCFWTLRAFLMPMVWAVMIVVATWPLLLGLQARLRGRRSLAVAVMTLLLLLVLVAPLSLAIGLLAGNAPAIAGWVRALATAPWPPPPHWLAGIPLIGARLAAAWQRVVELGPAGVSSYLAPFTGRILNEFAALAGGAGLLVLSFLLTVFLAAVLYLRGEAAAGWLRRCAGRIAGQHGERSLVLAARAIRAVALGVVGTSVIQAVLAGLGLAVCGIPAVAVLTTVVFICCLAQIGPTPVLVPAALWLFWAGHGGWGAALLVWTVPVAALATFLSPVLMKKTLDLPMLLVFAGVIGGLLAFGVIGLFLGPLVLAISWELLDAWVAGADGSADRPQEPVEPGP